ncbi:hypothetical protein JW835_05670 [bacterium]|nr:hypothetical protein [bacterium]
MERIQFIEHKGKKILLEDFSGMKPGDEFAEVLAEARKIIHSQSKSSVLALFDATDAMYDHDTLDQVKEFSASNTPYIKASAVVGITGLRKIALTAVSKLSGRDFKVFNSRREALDWLADQ